MTRTQQSGAPWRQLPSALAESPNLTLKDLGSYWRTRGTKNGGTGACRNCSKVREIKHLGLCFDCYTAADGLVGRELLSALLQINEQHNTGIPVAIADDNFKQPLVVSPLVKKSVVVEFGDAQLIFVVSGDTLDIKVEDGGDLIFMANNLDRKLIDTIRDMTRD